MIEYVIACAAVTAAIYLLGFLVVARHAALNELGGYPPYDLGEYAGAGLWGLLLGAVWPLLAVAVIGGAGIGWLLTRFGGADGQPTSTSRKK